MGAKYNWLQNLGMIRMVEYGWTLERARQETKKLCCKRVQEVLDWLIKVSNESPKKYLRNNHKYIEPIAN